MDAAATGPAATAPSQPPAMTPQMQQQLREAKLRRKKIDRAAGVATFNAWTAAVLAVFCLPFALFSMASLLAAMVLGAVAYVEFTGRKMLRELDETGPVVLAANQAVFGALIILYAIWHLYLVLTGQGYAGQMQAQIGAQVPGYNADSITGLIEKVELLTYALVIVGTLAFQGGVAWYYWTRRRHLRDYVEQTSRWIVDVLRAAA